MEGNVAQKIISDANKEAEGIIAGAHVRAEQYAKSSLAEREKNEKAYLNAAKSAADEMRAHEELRARLAVRKNTLAAKRGALDASYTKARERLAGMDDAALKSYVERHIANSGMSGAIAVSVNKTDFERYVLLFGGSAPKDGDVELAALASDLKKATGKDYNIILKHTPIECAGGFYADTTSYGMDFTLEAFMASLRELTETKAAHTLFASEE